MTASQASRGCLISPYWQLIHTTVSDGDSRGCSHRLLGHPRLLKGKQNCSVILLVIHSQWVKFPKSNQARAPLWDFLLIIVISEHLPSTLSGQVVLSQSNTPQNYVYCVLFWALMPIDTTTTQLCILSTETPIKRANTSDVMFNRANTSDVMFMFLGLTTNRFPDTKVLQERAGQSKYNWVTILFFSPTFNYPVYRVIHTSPVVQIRIFIAVLMFPTEDGIKAQHCIDY